MDVLDPTLITLELTPKDAQLVLDLLFVAGEQNRLHVQQADAAQMAADPR